MKNIAWLIVIFVGFTTCRKAEDRTCWKTPGKNTSIEIALPTFTKLHVHSKIKVVLVPDTEHKLVIHGGKNLVKKIGYNINDNGILELTNKNKCDFLNAYKKQEIVVEVHVVNLDELYFEGSKDLETRGILNSSLFILTIKDGSGTVNLNINCDFIQVYQEHGYGDFILNGSANRALYRITSNGYGDASNFQVKSQLILVSTSAVTSHVNAHQTQDFYAEIEGYGDVIYHGTPQKLNYVQYGKGKLIAANN